jgi:hypothetical protein
MNIKLIIKNLYKFLLRKFNLILKFFGCRLIVLAKKNSTNYLDIQNKFSLMSLVDSKGVLHLGGTKERRLLFITGLVKKLFGSRQFLKFLISLRIIYFFIAIKKPTTFF